ncbi:MAG: glycosyltransferase [Isosphaeraceae bacterium]|nr:glycosyltransferase [Isosphaeraceae bacterium]
MSPTGTHSVEPSRPRLTIAVPTYNGARQLPTTLAAILAAADCMEPGSIELIVQDDRSSDDTLELVERIGAGRFSVEVNAERLGLAGNWNACLERARAEWVSIIHQDDPIGLDQPLEHLAAAARHPDAGMIASGATVVDHLGAPITDGSIETGGLGPVDRRFEPGEALELLSVSNPIRCSGVSLRVDAVREIGGFDASYRYVVDWDLWRRLAARHPVVWLARPTFAFRWHAESETHRFKTGLSDLDETERMLVDPGPAASRRLARAALNRAYTAARSGNRSLEARALARAWRLSPRVVLASLSDPRLWLRLAAGRGR